MFKTGDKVLIKKYDDMPEEYQNTGMAKICGKIAEVKFAATTDTGKRIYILWVDRAQQASSIVFTDDMIEKYHPLSNIRFSVEIVPEERVIEAHMYDGDDALAMGFGRYGEETLDSIVQAASYAMKRLWLNVNPNAFEK